jgi:hypothetical protein
MCACVSGLFGENSHTAVSSLSDYQTQTMKLCEVCQTITHTLTM